MNIFQKRSCLSLMLVSLLLFLTGIFRVAADQGESPLLHILLDPGMRNLPRSSSTSFTLQLSKSPIIAHLKVKVWHQGTDEKPKITVNGFESGALEPVWPDLSDMNYSVFMFDDTKEKTTDYQVDYEDWLDAHGFIQGSLLLPGRNLIEIFVKRDWIKIEDVRIEILQKLDPPRRIYDCREETMKRMMEEFRRTGRVK